MLQGDLFNYFINNYLLLRSDAMYKEIFEAADFKLIYESV